jgi:phosphoenolpyruvate carboxylase
LRLLAAQRNGQPATYLQCITRHLRESEVHRGVARPRSPWPPACSANGADSDIAIASRYAELVSDSELRDRVFSRLRVEWQSVVDALLRIMGQQNSLESNPLLARSIRNRFPYLDPLNHVQIELLKRYRADDTDENVVTGIHLTINGLAAGLRNSG